uniref:Osteocalcin n=1 Tax=Chelydra serpentina TaxID=8475 RepID=A0A8C3SW67_CHESE
PTVNTINQTAALAAFWTSKIPGCFLAGPRSPARTLVTPRHRSASKSFYDIIHDPLEGKREICELNPDCDELADHIGFHEAYRRYYGPV